MASGINITGHEEHQLLCSQQSRRTNDPKKSQFPIVMRYIVVKLERFRVN